MSPDDPRLNPAGFDPIAARQGPAFTQTVTGQPLPSAQPPAFQTPRQPGYTHNIRGLPGYAPPPGQPGLSPDLLGRENPPDWTPRNTGRMGGQPDWLGGILGQLMGGGMSGGFAVPDMLDRVPGSGSRRNNQFTDLFGASAGQFGSGATGGQSTNAMSNPLSASPFGRNFSTRQMGIPARTMI